MDMRHYDEFDELPHRQSMRELSIVERGRVEPFIHQTKRYEGKKELNAKRAIRAMRKHSPRN